MKTFITATIVVIVALISLFCLSNNQFLKQTNNSPSETTESTVQDKPTTQYPKPEPDMISFQSVVDTWAASVGGNRSVLIYDVEHDELVGSYNPDEDYLTASLYKLFVVYEGYRRINSQVWAADMIAGSTGRTIIDCLDLAIRESHSPCAETLWNMIGHETLDQIIKTDFNITRSNISHLLSNSPDILAMMKIFYHHSDITDETLISRMKDSFLNQPVTTYDWRRGLPSGFLRAKVYNKVGWDYNPNGYWNIYHDAAIIEFPEQNRHYIVVVMTNRVSNDDIARLGTMIENEYYANNQ